MKLVDYLQVENPLEQYTIDYITIASTGNAVDFGDMIHLQDGTAMVVHHQQEEYLQVEGNPAQYR